MLLKFVKWFRGYLLVVIKGYSPERFINLCSNRDIIIWDIKKIPEGYSFHISLQAYLSLRPIARKTKTLPLVKKRIGFPFILKRMGRHKGFFIGVLIAAVLVYIMSLYIWDINVSGQYSHTEEAIVKFLKSENVYAGVMKHSISCSEIERSIRKKYTDIGWVSAEIRGTRLLIKITETNMPKPYEKQTRPCHIVADRDGIITSMVTRKGTPKVKLGDVVKKGDILIAGYIELKGEDDAVHSQEPVVADGDIRMKIYYEYKHSFPMNYVDKQYTNRSTRYYSVTLFGHSFYLLNPFKDYRQYELYDETSTENNTKLNENFYLPFTTGKTEYREYKEKACTYTKKEALEKAKKELNRYLEELQDRDVKILENQVQCSMDKETCMMAGKVIVDQPIHTTKEVDESELMTEPPATPTPTN